jgi:hypothetical protein
MTLAHQRENVTRRLPEGLVFGHKLLEDHHIETYTYYTTEPPIPIRILIV